MLRILLLLALASINHQVAANCVGSSDLVCCTKGSIAWCDSSEGCDYSIGNHHFPCRMYTPPPGDGVCWRGRHNICTTRDGTIAQHSSDNATTLTPVPPTIAQVEQLRQTLDLYGDGSTAPARMFFRASSTDRACVGTQFVQLGAAKLRTGCPQIIDELGLHLDAVIFGGFVAQHTGQQDIEARLLQLGFKEAPMALEN